MPVFSRPLAVGTYKPTPEFLSAPEHVAVCFDDDEGLVALTGYADDPLCVKESLEYAQLFAASPDLLKIAERAESVYHLWKRHFPNDITLDPFIQDTRAAIQRAKGA